METMLPLPINNISSNSSGTVQAPPESSMGGNFLQVLAQYFGEKANGEMASEDRGLENLDSSTLASLLAAFAVGNPPFVSREMRTSSGHGLAGSKEEPAPMANPLLEVYAQDKNLPGIQRETFTGPQSPFSSMGKRALFPPPLPAGGEKQGELPEGAAPLRNGIPSPGSAMGKGALFASPLPSGGEKQGELPEGAAPLQNGIPSSGSLMGNRALWASPLPSGNEAQAGQDEWVDRGQNPAAGVKPPTREGATLVDGELEKSSPGRFSIPQGQMEFETGGETGQAKVEPFDSPAPKKDIAGLPLSKDQPNGESLLPTGRVEIKPPVDASAGSHQESPFLSRQERFSGAEPPSSTRKGSAQTLVREKYSLNEEGPAPSQPTPPSSLQNGEWEPVSGAREEKEGIQVPGGRIGQAHISGKESQTSPAFYGASAPSTAPSPGFAEKVAGGKELFAPTRVEPQSVYQQVGERVLWLIRNQEEKIRISLDPPELGHLSLEIHRTKENIQATLYTDNPATKATLESSQPEIQKIVESEGFKLEKFDVLVQQDLGRQERREAHVPPDSRNSSASGKVEGAGSTLPDSFPRTPLQKHSGSRTLDFFV